MNKTCCFLPALFSSGLMIQMVAWVWLIYVSEPGSRKWSFVFSKTSGMARDRYFPPTTQLFWDFYKEAIIKISCC